MKNSECCFVKLKNNILSHKSKEYREECKRPINKLFKKFPGICKFCNGGLNKFVLLLKKGVYPYEIWIAGKNLMKIHYHLKKIFLVI